MSKKRELLPGIKKWLRDESYSRHYSDARQNMAKEDWLKQTLADLKRHEGYREFAYPDPLSKIGRRRIPGFGYQPARPLLAQYHLDPKDGAPWTVGYGETRGVTADSVRPPSLAERKLEAELIEHLEVLDNLIPEWKLMPVHVKTVLANMAYNLGSRLRPFAPTLQRFKEGKYHEAAQRLRKTLWFKQVGYRAEELVSRLENGYIEDIHKVI